MTGHKIDDQTRKALCARVELHELVGRSVPLKRAGKEYQARCPFHEDSTPSFTVSPVKGFYHCFGCGAHGDAITWLIEHEGMAFVDACKLLDERAFDRLAPAKVSPPSALPKRLPEGRWVPLLPVPEAAPALLGADGWTVPVWNAKGNDQHPDGRFVRYRPVRADAYLDERGRVLGYVLRLEFKDKGSEMLVKITPTVTWCVGPDGTQQWCVQHFRAPRPMLGLDALADKPDAPVLVVEGEKCRAAGAGAFPQYAVVSWPGGSKGIGYVDWAPLAGRNVVLWPDADQPGIDAMLGRLDHAGVLHRGVAQHAHRAGALSLRCIDTAGQPKGWDIADALDPEGDGWSARQLAAWAANRVGVVEIEVDAQRVAR